MIRERIIEIVIRFCKSKIYRRLEASIVFFEEGIFADKFAIKIKKHFSILKKGILKILISMHISGMKDGIRMYFYRLLRKFLPAFTKAWRICV
jgi:hypothetical protein